MPSYGYRAAILDELLRHGARPASTTRPVEWLE
jgi:hypothetical protein